MATTKTKLKSLQQDYLLARWESNELTMEPICACGNPLEDDYYCKSCERDCDCNLIACSDPQSLAIAEKLVAGNPNFRNYKAVLLDE